MQPLALQVVLDGATSTHWRVDADANDAAAEEKEHGYPLQHCGACALALHFRSNMVSTVRTVNLLRLFACFLFGYFFHGNGFVLDLGVVNLLDRSVLPMGYPIAI